MKTDLAPVAGTTFSILLNHGYGGGMVTHRGKHFLRCVFSKIRYEITPGAEEVSADICQLGPAMSLLLADKGFKLGVFRPLGVVEVPERFKRLPLFRAGQFVAEYDEETLEEKTLYEVPPPGREIISAAHSPVGLPADLLDYMMDSEMVWDFYWAVCRPREDLGKPLS